VVKVKTPFVADPVVNPVELQRVEDWYLRHYFTPKDEIERQWKDSLAFVGQEVEVFRWQEV